ncbi:MAG: hypothetical protein WDW36_000953 [Sanguina aurantia]
MEVEYEEQADEEAAAAAKREKAFRDADARNAGAAEAKRRKAAYEAAHKAKRPKPQAQAGGTGGGGSSNAGGAGSSSAGGHDSGAPKGGEREGGWRRRRQQQQQQRGGWEGGGRRGVGAQEAAHKSKRVWGSRWQEAWEKWIRTQLLLIVFACIRVHPAAGEAVESAVRVARTASRFAILRPISASAQLLPALLQRLNLRRAARALGRWGRRNLFAHLLLALPGVALSAGFCFAHRAQMGGHAWSVTGAPVWNTCGRPSRANAHEVLFSFVAAGASGSGPQAGTGGSGAGASGFRGKGRKGRR